MSKLSDIKLGFEYDRTLRDIKREIKLRKI